MPLERATAYQFRTVTEADLPMIAGWLAEPHVAEWWDDPETEIASISDHLDSVSVEPLIDMGRTAVNVSGSMTAGTVTGRLLGQLDYSVFSATEAATPDAPDADEPDHATQPVASPV